MRSRTENGARIAAELRARLRDADPLGAGADAATEERALARLATRIEFERQRLESPPPVRRFAIGAPLLAAATILAVAWLGVRFAERPRPFGTGAPTSSAVREALPPAAVDTAIEASAPSRPLSGGNEPESRQIQFETSGGTRVIWVLDPRFSL